MLGDVSCLLAAVSLLFTSSRLVVFDYILNIGRTYTLAHESYPTWSRPPKEPCDCPVSSGRRLLHAARTSDAERSGTASHDTLMNSISLGSWEPALRLSLTTTGSVHRALFSVIWWI